MTPRSAFAWGMPWGPVDFAERWNRPGSPISPPFPDLLVASGRRAVPYVRAVKRASGGRTFTVILKDPRTGTGAADLIWVPTHDRLRGPNVITSLTAPHRVSAARLAAARGKPDPRLAALPSPRVAVLLGGPSRHHRFEHADIARLIEGLASLAASGASLMVTTSRRTPDALRTAVAAVAAGPRHLVWDGAEPNPYIAMLALADAVVATADSTNMIGEATATGRPVLVFEPTGGHPKITAYLQALTAHGAVRAFQGRLEAFAYEPLDTSPVIAAAVAEAFARHRAARLADGRGSP